MGGAKTWKKGEGKSRAQLREEKKLCPGKHLEEQQEDRRHRFRMNNSADPSEIPAHTLWLKKIHLENVGGVALSLLLLPLSLLIPVWEGSHFVGEEMGSFKNFPGEEGEKEKVDVRRERRRERGLEILADKVFPFLRKKLVAKQTSSWNSRLRKGGAKFLHIAPIKTVYEWVRGYPFPRFCKFF